jgi:cytochrome c oxidase subunit 2
MCLTFFPIFIFPMSFLIGKPNRRFTTNKSFLLLGEQFKNEPKQMKLEWLFLTIAPCDAAEPWQLGFQDAATPMMQGIIDLHHDIFFFLILILVFVSRILVRALWHFHYPKNPIPQRIVHGTTIEIIRTIFPSIIPMFIAIPSFALLYSMDEVVVDPAITIKAIGHQWYRTYEYSDYNSSDEQSLTFDSYTIPEDDLELGQSRLLEVDNRVVVPAKTHLRIIVTPADVPHSWAVPSLGVKCDAVPGRLNQISISVQRLLYIIQYVAFITDSKSYMLGGLGQSQEIQPTAILMESTGAGTSGTNPPLPWR